MARPAEPGRTALLDTGRRLLSDKNNGSLGRMSVNAVVAEASMSKGAFFQHFPTRREYVLELHSRFHDEVWKRVSATTAELAPGHHRLQRGIETFLDACRQQRMTKALLFQARADVDLTDAVAHQNARFSRLAAPDLSAIGWEDPDRVARLLVAGVAEVAIAEAIGGHRHRRLRRALASLASR